MGAESCRAAAGRAGRRATRRIAGRACAPAGRRPYASPHASRRCSLALSACPRRCVAGCGGGDALRAVPTRRARSRRTRASTSRRPCGPRATLREDALAAAGKVLRTSTTRRRKIDELSSKAFAEDEQPKLDYERDIEPWLGEQVGVWAATTSGDGRLPRGGRRVGDRQGRGAGGDRPRREGQREDLHEAQLQGRRLPGRARTGAAGVVEDFVVLGTEARVQAHGRRAEGRRRSPTTTATARRPTSSTDDRLGTLLLRLQAAARPGGAPGPARPRSSSSSSSGCSRSTRSARSPARSRPTASGWRSTRVTPRCPRRSAAGSLGAITGGGATPLLGELPGDSWAALGVAEARPDAARLSTSSSAGALGGAAIEQQLQQQLRARPRRRTSSAGSATSAFFVARRRRWTTLDGGAVIQVTDDGEGDGGVRQAGRARAEPRRRRRAAGQDRRRRDGVRGRAARRAEADRARARRRTAS